jgi:hypothetical protein
MAYDIYSRIADKLDISRDEAKKRYSRLAPGAAARGLSLLRGPDAYLKFARNAWLRVFDPAADGVEVEIIRRERQIAQEESDVQPRK